MYRLLTAFLILQSVAACAQKKILFIGNSYTYVNDLPGLVSQLASANGDSLYYASSTPGGYTFQLHSTNLTTLSSISSMPWDYVVLQEQSQIPSFSPAEVDTEMFPYAIILDSLIHANNSCTQTIFYMTWGRKYGDASNCAFYPPVCTYQGMQERLRESYLLIADSVHARVSPVGISFRNCIAADSTLELYQTDYSHPSLAGSYLAACTFYASIYKRSPIGNTFIAGLDTATAAFLQNIASHTVLDSLETWNIGVYEPNASFTYTQNGYTVNFYSDSLHGYHHYWNLPDTTASPTHVYAGNGSYSVRHILCDGCRCDTATLIITINPYIGITDLGSNLSLSVYPNPTTQNLNLRAGDDLHVELIDIYGRSLRSIELKKDHTFILERKDLPAGIYFLKVIDRQNKTETRKIVFEGF
jgi:hypothetical protein